ncbi:hypothetical protein NS277_07345 [Novosphingobium barchaimii]|nr:hypothetical protein NS277_07345 [Novosphingobium barchaimii]
MQSPAPDSINRQNERNSGGPSPLPILFLGAILTAGLAGLFGGQSDPVREVRDNGTILSVRAPTTLRNGMLFETVIEVTPTRPAGDLVIAVSDGLWREMTINTTMPAAQEESHAHGYQRFSFGKAAPGDVLRFKVDGQINPPLFAGSSGEIAVFDGERKLVGLPVRIRVLP